MASQKGFFQQGAHKQSRMPREMASGSLAAAAAQAGPDAWTDVIIGTLIMVVVIGLVTYSHVCPNDDSKEVRRKAMLRSRSCKALSCMQNEKLMTAASDMMAAFDARPWREKCVPSR